MGYNTMKGGEIMNRINELCSRINRADERRIYWMNRAESAMTIEEYSRAVVQWKAWFNVTLWNMKLLDMEDEQ